MILDSIKTFLSNPHTGVLMIAGGWGTGKSYFVKHDLIDKIKNLSFASTDFP